MIAEWTWKLIMDMGKTQPHLKKLRKTPMIQTLLQYGLQVSDYRANSSKPTLGIMGWGHPWQWDCPLCALGKDVVSLLLSCNYVCQARQRGPDMAYKTSAMEMPIHGYIETSSSSGIARKLDWSPSENPRGKKASKNIYFTEQSWGKCVQPPRTLAKYGGMGGRFGGWLINFSVGQCSNHP